MSGSEDSSKLGPAAAYSAAVSAWLNQVYQAQMMHYGFQSFLAYQAMNGRFSSSQQDQQHQSSQSAPQPQQQGNVNVNLTVPNVGVNLNVNGGAIPLLRATLVETQQANTFVVPPIWKRIVAEVLDFMILFVLKVMITFVAVDAFDLIDLENYDLPLAFDLLNLNPENMKLDYNFAVQLTQEILILELVHRMVVCVFEALCIHRGPLGIPGGGTPGKLIMGLKVIKASQVTSLTLNRVQVVPASDLGFGWALLRSLVKNFSMAFFFPVCFSLMFQPHSRTLYDIMARSIVVENNFRIQRNIRFHR